MLRVAVLDDHPAVLAGLKRLLDSTPDLQTVTVADSAQQLSRQLKGVRADVVVLDDDLTDDDALTLCQALKQRVRPPAVVIYSAYAGPRLAIAARIAGADALVDKRAPASELLDAIRRAAAGDAQIPDVPPDLQQAAILRLAPDDVPVASMLLAGTTHQGIAETLATDRRDIVRRVRRIVGRLRPTTRPTPTADAHCRRCTATFDRPFPQPYGAICPNCLADGDIITLTAPPDRMSDRHGTVGPTVVVGGGRGGRQGSSDA
jgi:DNA-binding NarL/FixJ family response regulator